MEMLHASIWNWDMYGNMPWNNWRQIWLKLQSLFGVLLYIEMIRFCGFREG